MKVLLLGYSSIARRRVLPALGKLQVRRVDIATVSAADVDWCGAPAGSVYRDYASALRESDAEAVYVSTINSAHASAAQQALSAGRHVIIDKPACSSHTEARRLVALAESRNRCLAEASVYLFHPQFAAALNEFRSEGGVPRRLIATFTFPPLPADNFRYRRDLGGGAVADLGPYAVSPGRAVFGAAPLEIVARRIASRDEVETGFTIIAIYPGERVLVGTFDFTTSYMNRLDLLGSDMSVTIDRVFTPVADRDAELSVRCRDQFRRVRVPAADSFELFLAEFFAAVAAGDYGRFYDALLADSAALERLRQSLS